MDTERWEKIALLYHQAEACEPARRSEFLAEACRGDEELRRELESLLEQDASQDGVLERVAGDAVSWDFPERPLPAAIGRYRILRLVAEGGMGAVYEAEQDHPRRTVALKVIRPGLTAPELLRRFEQESEALGRLQHPGIAQIHEAGAADTGFGPQPYFAMEFIRGLSLLEHAKAHRLTTRQRLELMAQVCEAVHHAHERGIIHRDLKPDNILVDEKGQPKVLDFGVARVTDSEARATRCTDLGELVGTLAYMSPEQVMAEPLALDRRSDVYALGVILYEVLAGRLPYEVSGKVHEAVRAIREEDPAPLRVTSQSYRGDLETIVAKALEKEKERRYTSAADLAADIRRYLNDEPILARPASAFYQVRKFASRHKGLVSTVILATAIAGSLLEGFHLRNRYPPRATAEIRSLAVLPLENLSGDPGQEYFSDGLTDELIGKLAHLRGLRVISRTSIMQYKGGRKPLPQIARELDVDAVVEGTVARSGNRVRVRAQLVRAATDEHIWAEAYESDLRDVLTLQSGLARDIAHEIGLKLSAEQQAQFAASHPVNAEAHELYLRGRYFWNKRSPEAYKKASDYFEQAIRKDPNYAAAYAGLADAYTFLGGYLGPTETLPKARAAAERAIELDGQLAEAHAALAIIAYVGWNWAEVRRHLERALELSPNSATAHHWYGDAYLLPTGRMEEAIAEVRKAEELDPLSAIIVTDVGKALFYARRYDEAIVQLQKALELDPQFVMAHLWLEKVYLEKGLHAQATADLSQSKNLLEKRDELFASAYIAARAGRPAEARRLVAELERVYQREFVHPDTIAVIYVALGDKDQAFLRLGKSPAQESGFIIDLKVAPFFDPLRSDPRFQDLIRRVGLPP